jgi:hypothetical protein
MIPDPPNIDPAHLSPVDPALFAAPDDPDHPPRILILHGAVRARPYSRVVGDEAARLLNWFGAEVRRFGPSGLPLPDDADAAQPSVNAAPRSVSTCWPTPMWPAQSSGQRAASRAPAWCPRNGRAISGCSPTRSRNGAVTSRASDRYRSSLMVAGSKSGRFDARSALVPVHNDEIALQRCGDPMDKHLRRSRPAAKPWEDGCTLTRPPDQEPLRQLIAFRFDQLGEPTCYNEAMKHDPNPPAEARPDAWPGSPQSGHPCG